jgi:hypothetical protein
MKALTQGMDMHIIHSPKNRKLFAYLLLIGALIVGFTGSRAHAQADQGAITGTIQDPTGAVVTNAKVTLTQYRQRSYL